MSKKEWDARTFFASPEVMSVEEVEKIHNQLIKQPLIDILMRFNTNFVGLLNSHRQFLILNSSFFESIDYPVNDSDYGFRPGEILKCVHFQTSPSGCGTSKGCEFCGILGTVLKAIRLGVKQSGEAVLNTGSGESFTSIILEVTAEPIKVQENSVIVLFLKDIRDTKRKEFLERLFFHDIKNSLHSLSGLVQIAQYSEETDPNIPQLIDLIMEDITDQMHYHQKLTLAYQNDLSLNIEHFEISQQIKNLVGSFIELRGSRSTAIEVSHNLCSVYIESDLVLFRRIIMNMFKNAYEASQDGDSIIVSNDVYPDRLKINVWNSQPIPLPVQAQIFQQTFSTKGRGRGLGTYGIKMLSNRYLGGDVTFRSEANHGTTFTLDLPIVAAKLT